MVKVKQWEHNDMKRCRIWFFSVPRQVKRRRWMRQLMLRWKINLYIPIKIPMPINFLLVSPLYKYVGITITWFVLLPKQLRPQSYLDFSIHHFQPQQLSNIRNLDEIGPHHNHHWCVYVYIVYIYITLL